MSEYLTIINTLIIGVASGGMIGGYVALKKDRRDTLKDDLDYTEQFRTIAKEEVEKTREELKNMGKKVNVLEGKVVELEKALRLKDRTISLLVAYIGRLRDVLDQLKPKHPLPQVPDELKEYLK